MKIIKVNYGGWLSFFMLTILLCYICKSKQVYLYPTFHVSCLKLSDKDCADSLCPCSLFDSIALMINSYVEMQAQNSSLQFSYIVTAQYHNHVFKQTKGLSG